MEKELLNLIPKRFLCPYCGEWHEWNDRHKLGYYDSIGNRTSFECSNVPYGCNKGDYRIYFCGNSLCYSTEAMCRRANQFMSGTISISSIRENLDKPRVTFDVDFTSDSDVGMDECSDCKFSFNCNCVRLGDEGDNRHMTVTLGFEFEQCDYEKFAKAGNLALRDRELTDRENALKSRERAIQELLNALGRKQERHATALQKSKTDSKEDFQELSNAFESMQEHENALQKSETDSQKEEKMNQEEIKMAEVTKKGTSIKKLLYERSPKENMATLKSFADKYKPVLKWAVPVAAVYVAYRILNSDEFDLSVNNLAEICEEKLGFKMECLENKKALKELMVLGGLSAGAYGAVQALSGFLGVNNEEKEISADVSVEEVETEMKKLQSISKKFSWLQPKTENMLPIALSVIMVYVTLHKPKFTGKLSKKVKLITEDMQIRFGLYMDLAKDFIHDKFNIDLSDEEEKRKLKVCAFLLALMGILAFLYGKKVLGDKSEADDKKQNKEINKSVEAFVTQAKTVVEKLAPAIYTYLITLFASKKILMLEEAQNVLEKEGVGDEIGHQDESEDSTAEKADIDS